MQMWHEGLAKRLSRAQRDMLIQHIDRPQPAVVDPNKKTRDRLVEMKLLKLCGADGQSLGPRLMTTTHTRLTDDGREVLGWILAGYVEMLMAAGCLPDDIVVEDGLVPSVNAALTRMAEIRRATSLGARHDAEIPLPSLPGHA